jgi:molybdate transport system substrate-binding protein
MRKELIVLLVLLGVFLAIGCAEKGGEAPDNTSSPVAAETSAAGQEPETIMVSAAASLTESFTDIAAKYEAENPGVDVNLNFASSGNLRTQIEAEAPVDVFASADEGQMDKLATKSLIDNSTREDFAENSLVLIVPANSTLNITSLENLTDPQVERIAIGNPDSVPVGNYTRLGLTEAGLWNQTENKFVLGEDVKQVLTYVERGEVDAGFVYMTDTKTAEPGTIEVVTDVPVSIPVTYPIAVVSYSENKEEAQDFIDFVTGTEGKEILNEYGFA